jgi:ABC-type multidrug transport system fused ATPase/permease subunit
MNYPGKILFKTIVKPFYKENAGVFIFLFTMMFYIVGVVDGAGLFAYHYSLIIGMLSSYTFLLLVFVVWLLYAAKCTAFVSATLYKPEYAFLDIYNRLSKVKRFRLFLATEAWLLLPVLLYALLIVIAGCYNHLFLPILFVIVYILLLCITAAAWFAYLLNNTNKNQSVAWRKLKVLPQLSLLPYFVILIRFVANKQKNLWLGIKLFTCGVLYLIARNNTPADLDTSTAFLFFNFGILANGVLVYRIRAFEETYLNFYRGLPVSLVKRFLQYSRTYLVLFIPECITTAALTPKHLRYADALNFMLCGFSLLVLMNSITFLHDFKMKDYLKILLLLFFVLFAFMVTIGFTFLYMLFFILAIAFFARGYYKFEGIVL